MSSGIACVGYSASSLYDDISNIGNAGNKKGADLRYKKPENQSPEGAGRKGAFREAKRKNNIPVSEQPNKVRPNVDRRGNKQPGRIYEFDNGVVIRDDAAGHVFGDNPYQNRGPHFNDPSGNHFDY